MTDRSATRLRWGAALLLLRPTYVLTEVVAAAGTTGGYSWLDDTVSDLGATGCSPAYCSTRHAVMNGSFIVYGVLLAVAAVLLVPVLGRVASGLLVLAGVASVGVGLAPVDESLGWHMAVATPVFVAQPVALLALAWVLRSRRAVAGPVLACGLASVVGAVGFVLVDGGAGTGGWERLALWSVLVGLAVVGAHAARVAGLTSIQTVRN